MISDYCKCNYCKWDDDWGCEAVCSDYDAYEPSAYRLIEKAKELDISVPDLIALIEIGAS